MPTPLDRPRLRPGLAAARDDRDPHAVVVYDQFRLTRQFLRLSPSEFTWLQWLDGSNTLRDVQVAAMRQSGGALVPIEPLLALVEKRQQAFISCGKNGLNDRRYIRTFVCSCLTFVRERQCQSQLELFAIVCLDIRQTFFEHELSQAQIAAELGVSQMCVSRVLTRTIRLMRAQLSIGLQAPDPTAAAIEAPATLEDTRTAMQAAG